MGGTLASFHNPSVDIPSTDEEFRDAIKALQASTEAIERQTRTINAQAAYLAKLKADDDAANQRRSTHASYLNQREAAEIQHVTFSVYNNLPPPKPHSPWCAKDKRRTNSF